MTNLFGVFARADFPRAAPTSIFDFKVKDATGGEVDLADYKGQKKAFIVVNVASK